MEYKTPTLADKALFNSYFEKYPNDFSKYNFVTIFVWRDAWEFKFCEYKNHLLIINKNQKFEPVGPNPEEIMKELGGTFDKVKEEIASKFDVKEEREDHFDYVHLTSELAELKGSKFEAKRNFVKRFENYEPKVCILNNYTKEEFAELQTEWIKDREHIEGIKDEHLAVIQAIKNYKELELHGICIRVEGEIVGFAIGKTYGDTFIEFFEKGNIEYKGIYQYILKKLAENVDVKYINRGQDIGIEGMKKAKQSYHPIKMIKKYSVKV